MNKKTKNIIAAILLTLGISVFVVPFAIGIYMIILESWSLFDWVLMYSVIYWPTYIIGLVLVAAAVIILASHKLFRFNKK